VRAHIKKERGLDREKRREREELKTDLDFGKWYGGLGEELLHVSHEEYQYVYFWA
jgi:hypothetical protein